MSIARYSFIQLSELEQCRVKKLVQGFHTAAQDSKPGSRSRKSEGLPLSHCALQGARTRLITRKQTFRMSLLEKPGIQPSTWLTIDPLFHNTSTIQRFAVIIIIPQLSCYRYT